MIFHDRHDAGIQLASKLQKYAKAKNTLVLGLARGGVVVAYEVAKALELPLNVIVVRKIGAPGNEELAVGAVTEKGEGTFNENLITILGVSSDYLKREVEKEKRLAGARGALYRGDSPPLEVKDKTLILVDDGIATGASVKAAIKSLKGESPHKIILAIPLAAPDSLRALQKEVDETVCLSTPSYFEAVGSFYKFFDQTSDQEIVSLLKSSKVCGI